MGCAAQMLSVAVTRAGGEVTGERAVTVVVLLQVRSHVRVDACARVDAAILGLLRLALDLAWHVMVCGWGGRVFARRRGGPWVRAWPYRDMASIRSRRRPQQDAYVEIVCGVQRLEPLDMRAGRALSSAGGSA